jgi:hypothetical protein
MKVQTAASQVQIFVQITVHTFIMLPANKPSMQIMKAIYMSNKGQHEEKPRLSLTIARNILLFFVAACMSVSRN